MIQFYKPNAKNTGAACSFWYNPEHGCFYTNIIQQASWNAKAKTGSFKANLENPNKFIKIKLNINEIGGILDCLDRGRECQKIKLSLIYCSNVSSLFIFIYN